MCRYSDKPEDEANADNRFLPRLMEFGGLHPRVLAKVAAALRRDGEDPDEFRVELERAPDSRFLTLHLWHESASLPENRHMLGNPGGRCRDISYDELTGQLSYSRGWE